VVLPPLVYAAALSGVSNQIGVRHLLPAYPFLFVWLGGLVAPGSESAVDEAAASAAAAAPPAAVRVTRITAAPAAQPLSARGLLRKRGQGARTEDKPAAAAEASPDATAAGPEPPSLISGWLRSATLLLLLLWQAVAVLHAFPDFIGYFNQAAGQGHLRLTDSNIDWGQGLPALRCWQQEQQRSSFLPEQSRNATLHLSYFGTDDPRAKGIEFEPMFSYFPLQPPSIRDSSFREGDLFAISVSILGTPSAGQSTLPDLVVLL
jgi:hypothetical protein